MVGFLKRRGMDILLLALLAFLVFSPYAALDKTLGRIQRSYLIDPRVRQAQVAQGTWETATGKVVLTRTMAVQYSRDIQYRPVVVYTYAVDGVTYESSRLSFFDQDLSSERLAEDRLYGYDPGDTITVWYRPSAPERSVLDMSIPQRSPVDFFIGIIPLALIAAAAALTQGPRLWRWLRRHQVIPSPD